jgi:hypothetical protein
MVKAREELKRAHYVPMLNTQLLLTPVVPLQLIMMVLSMLGILGLILDVAKWIKRQRATMVAL